MVETRTVQLETIRLSYAEWPGQKGPLICLPSLAGHKGAFASLAAGLAPAYRVLALDLRGRGDSDKPAEGYGFAYHARDILHFADALGLDSFILVGHSFGATLAVYLASIRPGRVRAMALLDGGADPKERVLAAMEPALAHLGRVYPSVEAYVEAMQALPFYRPWSQALEAYVRQEVEVRLDRVVCAKSSAAALKQDLDLHFYTSMCLHFPALRCPVLFLRPEQGLLGERGHIFSPEEAAAVVASIPDCRQVDVPGVNHYTMLLHDAPPVLAPIRAFLETVC